MRKEDQVVERATDLAKLHGISVLEALLAMAIAENVGPQIVRKLDDISDRLSG